MIVPMLKYTILCHHLEYDEFLDKLYELGVVHIIEKNKEEVENYKKNKLELKVFEKSLKNIAAKRNITGSTSEKLDDDVDILLHVQEMEEKITELEKQKEKLLSIIELYNKWGNFNLNSIKKLNDLGIKVKFFKYSIKKYKPEWESKYTIEIIHKDKSEVLFICLLYNNEEIDIPAKEIEIPNISLLELKEKHDEILKQIENVNKALDNNILKALSSLEEEIENDNKELDYKFVFNNSKTISDEKVIILEGWVPETRKKKLNKNLDEDEMVYFTESPKNFDEVPVLLKNNKFSKLFEPIGKLFSLPEYAELDLTPFFAPFFMLFFGFCLGDAGYGLIFIILATLLKPKVKPELKPILSLGQYLGIATVLFGALSGTLFGINLIDTGYTITGTTLSMLAENNIPKSVIESISALKGMNFSAKADFIAKLSEHLSPEILASHKLSILKFTESDYSFLNSFRYLMQDPTSMFYLSIIIGAVQIIFGMIIKILNLTKQKGFKYSLSNMGWVLLIIILIVFMGGDKLNLIPLEQTKIIMNILLVLAGILIIFFNNPDSKVFLRPLNAIWDAYGMLTGVFGDLLSYIRLFALGISSAILGFVFNDISSQFLSMKYIGWLPFLLLLLFGHSINIFLAALGGFIHPMRLTFVEFYKNAGFTGGGKEYKPFKK